MPKSRVAILALAVSFALAGCVESRQPAAGTVAKTEVLQVKEDLARGRRWELGWGTVDVYDIATDELVHVVHLEGANLSASRDTRLPDMLLTPAGAMLVSSNAQPVVWRINPERFEVERFHIEVDRDQDQDFGFSGLAWGAHGRELHAVSAATGSAWRIDLARGKATRVGVE